MATVAQVDDDFITECKNVMGFLVTEHGFSEPELKSGNLWTSLTYCKRDVGVECTCDLRDEFISVYLVRLENGKIPEFGYKRCAGWVNSKGEVAKEYLLKLIQNRVNIPVSANGISQRQAGFRSTLLRAKHTLIEHGKSVLDGSADVFNNPSPSQKKQADWNSEDYEKVMAMYKYVEPGSLHYNSETLLVSVVCKIKEAAEVACKNKDYKYVVKMYELLAAYLTDEEKEHLEYAKKQV